MTDPNSLVGTAAQIYELSASLHDARRERDEACAERDALAHVIEQAPHGKGCSWYGWILSPDPAAMPPYQRCTCWKSNAPTVSLARHGAEVLHAAADAPFVERDRDGYMPGYCECGNINEGVVRQSLRDRAAAIRAEAGE